jgi:anhydro-N-acetylmuramic acid kinase
MWVIGLMSGTSADGVDAALVEWPDDARARPFRLLAYQETAFPGELQRRIHRLASGEVPAADALCELVGLDVELGERFAEAALDLVRRAGVAIERVAAIASHGQTVAHHPERHGTLQIGSAAVIAERTGRPVVADFRPRDMAAGGEGAPLAPFFHRAAFADARETRAVLNLGGIANLTWLPAGEDPDAVLAFDVGPANSLLDGAIVRLTDGAERMDRDGARARRGRVDRGFLAELLDDAYLRRPPPKSTGRERYGPRLVDAILERWRRDRPGAPDDDLVATLAAYTVESVALACLELVPRTLGVEQPLARLLVGGGGAANPALMTGLATALPAVTVEAFDAHDVPAAAAEAMAFSLMGRNTLLGEVNHLPRCTGARSGRVLGQLVPGAAGRWALP